MPFSHPNRARSGRAPCARTTGGPTARTGRATALLVACLVAALGLAGCGGGSKDSSDDGSPGTQSTQSGQRMEAVSPLTGLAYPKGAPHHSIFVVKIDNSSDSAPQVGLHAADLVTEELVEGGITRLAVFFDSQLPKVVGPVRSMRATDIGVVQPVKGVLVTSGGAAQTLHRVRAAGIRFVQGGPGYFRDYSRVAPHNLMVGFPEMARAIKKYKRPSASYLPFGAASDFPSGRPAKGLTARFSFSTATQWQYRGGHYVNTNSNAAAGDRIDPDTVLVLRVKVGDAGYLDPAGNPVPETQFTGKGKALVFNGGHVLRATWTKKGYDAPVGLHTAAGALRLPPGKVWLELVPVKTGDVTIQK